MSMATPAEAPLLEVRGVSKTFDGVVRALDEVTITVHQNEIVGVVGENGAGKSTLMKILVGVYAPDKGELYYRGRRVPFPRDPKEAAGRGISIVYQEKGVIPHLQVYQFLLLGHEDKYVKFSSLQIDTMKRVAGEILEELRVDCDIESFMYELPLSTQKMVEIAKAILSIRLEREDTDTTPIIILDEPTAPLAIEERQGLFNDILAMKRNSSFIFVSHIIPEVREFADRVYVLRDGKQVAYHDLTREKVTEEDLFRAIVGRGSSEYLYKPGLEKAVGEEIALTASNLTKNSYYYDISFHLHRGECIGLFGPAGSGKSEIIRTIAGLVGFDKGSLTVKGQTVKADELPHLRLERGIGYFSGETGKELFLNWPIAKNISIVNIGRILLTGRVPVISFSAERKMAERIVKKLRIAAPSVNTDCTSLSGGSKQKVSVGKWLERSPDILLLEDPTIGIDVGAREDIYEVLLEMKKSGASMILVSDDPKEYSILCDTIIFIKGGRMQRVLSPAEFREVTAA
ncbi:MAG: sugar ABC transporter ATP-binding protein [Anaerolineae bacterium]|nr:sugar ABC transporter ATP-binding protein [Anaerolineae bacterium]